MTVQLETTDKLSPIERLEALCDRGSLTLLRSDVRSRRMGEKSRAGDGVIAGAGRVDGRPVFCYAQDPSYLGGSLGEQHADSIVRVLRLAGRAAGLDEADDGRAHARGCLLYTSPSPRDS